MNFFKITFINQPYWLNVRKIPAQWPGLLPIIVLKIHTYFFFWYINGYFA